MPTIPPERTADTAQDKSTRKSREEGQLTPMPERQTKQEEIRCPKCRQRSLCEYAWSTESFGSISPFFVMILGGWLLGPLLARLLRRWIKKEVTGVKITCSKCGHVFWALSQGHLRSGKFFRPETHSQ